MDFCVKCGRKEVHNEGLCRQCHAHEYPEVEKEVKLKKVKVISRHPLYFEATLQLRNQDQEIMGFVEGEIKRKKAAVAKVVKAGKGYDYYLASAKFAQQLGKALKENFSGLLKVTVRLYSQSRETSRIIYRVTVLYKKAPFKKGDWITVQGHKVKIEVMGKEVWGTKENGEKVHYKFKDLERFGII